MQHIDPASLEHLPTRIQYLRNFIGFSTDDAAALHAAKPYVAPLVPVVIDMVYEKLLSFDITANAFVPRQPGYTGEIPTQVKDLSLDHPQIRFRKDFLTGYVQKLVSMDYASDASWEYLDKVGLMHTGAAGFAHRSKRPGLRVEYIHCAILLGYVEDILVNAVATHPDLDLDTKVAVMRAVNKVQLPQSDHGRVWSLLSPSLSPPSSLHSRRVNLRALMFGIIRRISSSFFPRPDRPWADDATSNAPTKGKKRRLSSTEREQDQEEDIRRKKIRGESAVSEVPSEAQGTPQPETESSDVKEVTQGVKTVELSESEPTTTVAPEAVPLPGEEEDAGDLEEPGVEVSPTVNAQADPASDDIASSVDGETGVVGVAHAVADVTSEPTAGEPVVGEKEDADDTPVPAPADETKKTAAQEPAP
ncbi:hypothetical protein C0991_009551 [Blastosporella zonata]|nr:hypothetical protein C0991_009551 [Blastosporella zonata]